MPTTTLEVRRADERSRYELVGDDGVVLGVCDYRRQGDLLLLPHTEIDAAHRGQGLGEVLVRGALEDVRARGEKVVPGCWYVAEFLHLHPDFGDLLA